jgi:hypothetical protein
MMTRPTGPRPSLRRGFLTAFACGFVAAAVVVELRLRATANLGPPLQPLAHILGVGAFALGAACAISSTWYLGMRSSRVPRIWKGALLGALGFASSFPAAGLFFWIMASIVYQIRLGIGATDQLPGWAYLASAPQGWMFLGSVFGPMFVGPLLMPALAASVLIGILASVCSRTASRPSAP